MDELSQEQVANIVGPDSIAVQQLPHFVTDLDEGFVDVLAQTQHCTVGLWNYPFHLIEELEPAADGLALADWASDIAQKSLRAIVRRSNVSLYGRDVALVDARTNEAVLGRLLIDGQYRDDMWTIVPQVIGAVRWIAIPCMPNSNMAIYCASRNLANDAISAAEAQQRRGKRVWVIPPERDNATDKADKDKG